VADRRHVQPGDTLEQARDDDRSDRQCGDPEATPAGDDAPGEGGQQHVARSDVHEMHLAGRSVMVDDLQEQDAFGDHRGRAVGAERHEQRGAAADHAFQPAEQEQRQRHPEPRLALVDHRAGGQDEKRVERQMNDVGAGDVGDPVLVVLRDERKYNVDQEQKRRVRRRDGGGPQLADGPAGCGT
jgi:hypothetical protein